MKIKTGTIYQFSNDSFMNYNSANTLKITSHYRSMVQFSLGNKQGHGSMPVQHLRYLLKRRELTEIQDEQVPG